MVVYYFFVVIASTVPVPAGMFVPSFVLGGIIGRFVGEVVAFSWHRQDIPIFPGVYAVVGAAAFCGGVSHTVSVAVIIFELTGQLVYIIPVMVYICYFYYFNNFFSDGCINCKCYLFLSSAFIV